MFAVIPLQIVVARRRHGEALIEVRADPQILAQRLAQVLLVDARSRQRLQQRLGRSRTASRTAATSRSIAAAPGSGGA